MINAGDGGMKKEQKKLQVMVSPEIAENVKKYASYMGLSISAFCAIAIGEKIMQYEKAYQMLDKFTDGALAEVSKNLDLFGDDKKDE